MQSALEKDFAPFSREKVKPEGAVDVTDLDVPAPDNTQWTG
jgi:hypothetical protein